MRKPEIDDRHHRLYEDQTGKFVLRNGYIRCAVFSPNFMPPRNREKNCPRPRNREEKVSAAALSPEQLRGNVQLRNKIPRERAIARKIARECEIARKIARECTVAKISCESAVSLDKCVCGCQSEFAYRVTGSVACGNWLLDCQNVDQGDEIIGLVFRVRPIGSRKCDISLSAGV